MIYIAIVVVWVLMVYFYGKHIVLAMPLLVTVFPLVPLLLGRGQAAVDILISLTCIYSLRYARATKQNELMKLIKPLVVLSFMVIMHIFIVWDYVWLRISVRYLSAFALFASSYTYIDNERKVKSFLKYAFASLLVMITYVIYASFYKVGSTLYAENGGFSIVYLGEYGIFNFIGFAYFISLFPSYLSVLKVRKFVLVPIVLLSSLIIILVTKRNYMIMILIAFSIFFFYKPKRLVRGDAIVFVVILFVSALVLSKNVITLVEKRFEVREQQFQVKLSEHSRLLEFLTYPTYLADHKTSLNKILFGMGDAVEARHYYDAMFHDTDRKWHSGVSNLLYSYGIIGFGSFMYFFWKIMQHFNTMKNVNIRSGSMAIVIQSLVIIAVAVYGIMMEWMSNLFSSLIPFAMLGVFLGYMNSNANLLETSEIKISHEKRGVK